MELQEGLLPSGRGVRYIRMRTKEFTQAHERTDERVGKGASEARFGHALNRELILSCVRFITPRPLTWIEKDGKVDVDAMLDGATWIPISYEEMIKADGQHSFDELFAELTDYQEMTDRIKGTAVNGSRREAVQGKVRTVSIA